MKAEPIRQTTASSEARAPRDRAVVPEQGGARPAVAAVPPRSQPAHADTARRQRSVNRRRHREFAALYQVIERNWILIAPAMALVLVWISFVTTSFPRVSTIIMAVTAIGLVLASRPMMRFEQERCHTPTHKAMLVAGMLGLPMFLFGAAVARFTVKSGAPWETSMGALVIVGALAAIILNRRVSSLVASKVGLWSGVTVVGGSAQSYGGLALGALIGGLVAMRQGRIDTELMRRQIEAERSQLRAEEILNDFEQTGQGWFWETDRRGQIAYISPIVADRRTMS